MPAVTRKIRRFRRKICESLRHSVPFVDQQMVRQPLHAHGIWLARQTDGMATPKGRLLTTTALAGMFQIPGKFVRGFTKRGKAVLVQQKHKR
jgi:hypothetical protein